MRSARPYKKLSSRLAMAALVAIALALPLSTQAEPFGIQNDLQAWQIFSIKMPVTKRTVGSLDLQSYTINLAERPGLSYKKENFGTLLVRPALGFQLNKYVSMWQGYAWTPSFEPKFRNEHRIWQQVIFEKKFESLRNLTLSNRTRFETRRIEDAGGVALRLRSQFKAVLPLGKSRWSLVMYDEPFINLNTVENGPRGGFNQNRLFAGVNRQITRSLNAEIGYLNNYVNNPLTGRDRMNHVVLFSMSYTPGFSGIDLKRTKPDAPRFGQNQSDDGKIASSKRQLNADAETLSMPQVEALSGGLEALLLVSEPQLEIHPIIHEDEWSDDLLTDELSLNCDCPSREI